MIRYDMMPTNQGELLVAIDERGLVHVDFVAGLRPLPVLVVTGGCLQGIASVHA